MTNQPHAQPNSSSRRVPLLKVCGITNLGDARAALDAGADWLGLILVPGSPRCVSIAEAETWLPALRESHPHTTLVGVFQDASPEDVKASAQALQLDAVQLHGHENPLDYAGLALPLIPVLQLKPDLSMAELQAQAAHTVPLAPVRALLLDLPKGSGFSSIQAWPNYARLRELTQDVPCLIAGGLSPENVASVLNDLTPWGVDVASGVEKAPGQKDRQRLQAFGELVKLPANKPAHLP